MTTFISINPYTEEILAEFALLNDKDLDETVAGAAKAQRLWKKLSYEQRSPFFLKLADLIRENKDMLAAIAVGEMGKPIKEAEAEVLKCTTACEYYGNETVRILKKEFTITDLGKKVELLYEPMGIVLGIFPWNFPYWQIIRSAIPVLMGGNAMLIKPAPNVPKCAMALQKLFEESGLPQGIVQTLFVNENQVATLIKDNRISACTLTGSEKAGASVASQAALQIKKSVLELGGSDPFIVLDDADLDKAAETAITARFQNNGQSCIAAKRFILHKKIEHVFLEKIVKRIEELKLGDPMDTSVNIGPLARKDLKEKLQDQIEKSLMAGAVEFYTHKGVPTGGYFYPPSILSNIPVGCPAYSEELFGPVIAAFSVEDENEAIRIANDTAFGLGACVWTADPDKGQRVAEQLVCGQVFINGLVKSHAHYPFGGAKRSGFGRELGEMGIKEFCNVKTIWS